MNTQDIVKEVRRLKRRIFRERMTKAEAEDELRRKLQEGDLEWALNGLDMFCSYQEWPPIQRGSSRLVIRVSKTGKVASRVISDGDHVSWSEKVV